ncbi:MAG: hypothetical protein M0R00_01480 [Candidatus Omnitrophica bacterium]|jgi:hypothetical protein|nr:hypothetical protein [Candidatus Omnitrophota bacterium]
MKGTEKLKMEKLLAIKPANIREAREWKKLKEEYDRLYSGKDKPAK